MARSKKKLLNRRTRKYKKSQKGGDKHKLIVKLQGGLGNRFFQIMAGLGFAEKWKNYDIFLKEGGYNHVSEEVSKGHILQLFSNIQPPLKFINKNNNNSSYKVIGEKSPLEFTITEDPNSNCILDGYFQSDKYFPKKQPKLNLLEPKNNIISTINKDKLFFIHIRLGDLFGDNKDYKLPPTYYKNGIKKILEKKSDAIFLILSQDINGVKQYVNDNLISDLSKNTIIYDESNDENRLDSIYYMSKSRGGICCNSTFSWMGAYMIRNSDLIFMPKPWIKNNNYNDIYPKWATLLNSSFNSQAGGRLVKQRDSISTPKKILVSYATQNDRYGEGQKKLIDSAITVGEIDEAIALGPDDLPQEFKDKYKQFFEQKRGAGYWVWKPYIILEEFKKLENKDDILIYIDSDKSFLTSINTYLNNFKADKSIMVFQLSDGFIEKQWTKMDIFKKLNCENNKDITDTAQIESGYCILRNNQDSLNFLNTWFELNTDFNLVNDEPSKEKNFNEFIENRHDQSLFSCIAKLNKDNYKIQIEKTPTDYGNPVRNEGFPQLLNF